MLASRLKRLSEWTAEWAIRLQVLVLSSASRRWPGTDTDTRWITQVYIQYGWQASERQQYGWASFYSRSAVAINPKEPWGYLVTAFAYFKSGREAEVRAYLDRLPPIDPADHKAFLLVGDLNLELGHPDKAETAYRQSLVTNPDDIDLIRKLALAIYRQGRYKEVAALLDPLMIVAPDYLDACYLLAMTRERRGDQEGALALLKGLIERHPESAEAHYNLALSHARGGDWQQSKAEAEKAIDIDPDNPDYQEFTDRFHADQGQN